MTGANLTQIHSIHFTPFFWIDGNETNLDSQTLIDLYNSVSATRNTIRVTAYDASKLSTKEYDASAAATVDLDLYRSVEIQAKDGDTLKCYPRWIKDQTITVTEGKITTIENLPAAWYKLVPSTATNLTINVSYFDEPRYVNPGYVKGTYGEPTSVIGPDNYAKPNAENVVLPTA